MRFLFTITLFVILLSTVFGLYDAKDKVVQLTNMDKVLKSDDFWLVEFFAPWCGHCKSLAPEYKQVANALAGIAKVGAVDVDANQAIGGQYGIQGFPTIKLFGVDKNKPIDYQGPRTAKGLADFVLSEQKKAASDRLNGKSSGGKSSSKKVESKVVNLVPSSFDSLVLDSEDVWMVEFYAPWCGHCKNLAPHWERAAAELDGMVKLGAVDATVHQQLAAKYGVQGYPTIKVFKGKQVLDYNGGRTASDIIQYAKNIANVQAKPKSVAQLTDSSVFEKQCGESNVCLIAFLPSLYDSSLKQRQDYLDTLSEISIKQAQKPFTFIWTEGGQQPELEQTLNVGGSGYPAVAIVSLKKNRYTTYAGAFKPDNMNIFLNNVYNGKESLSALSGEVKIATVDRWDGKDVERTQTKSSIDVEEDEELAALLREL